MIRVIVGGAFVSAFSFFGGWLKPKSFAGLFGAAPSVALATLVLTVTKDGKSYASLEARSMVLGAVAFIVYAFVLSRLLFHRGLSVLSTASLTMVLWFGCSFGLWYAIFR